jgi:hypothetical protein
MREILEKWRQRLTLSRGFDESNDTDRVHFIEPVMRLVNDLDGDGSRAWSRIVQQHNAMLADGLTPIKLSAVVNQIRSADLASKVDHKVAPGDSAHVAAQYAQMRNEFMKRKGA